MIVNKKYRKYKKKTINSNLFRENARKNILHNMLHRGATGTKD